MNSAAQQIAWGKDYINRAYGDEHDAAVLRAAVQVIRRRRKKKTFTGDVLVRVLERSAERLEAKRQA